MSRSPRLIHINSKRLRVETLGTVSKCWWFQSRLARVGKFLRATATMGACCEKEKRPVIKRVLPKFLIH